VASPAADPTQRIERSPNRRVSQSSLEASGESLWRSDNHDALLRHLRQAKVVAPPPLTNGSDLELMILEYQGFLLSERSLMPSTTGKYLEAARRFLFAVSRMENSI